jgi:UDP-glucose 4-epimerase
MSALPLQGPSFSQRSMEGFMRVLVAGGAGFIGSHIVDQLLDRGDQVCVIDNFATARRDNLKPHANLEIIEASIADTDKIDSTFSNFQPEIVVHAAASYKDPDNWLEDAQTNVVGGVNLIKAALVQKVKRFIYFQTALCYGLNPLEEPITLTHPYYGGTHDGGSSYAISKTGAEQYLALSGLDFISFRLANAYGPRNLSGPLPTFFHRLTQGKPCFVMDTRRDFIFVGDLVDVVMKAIDGKGSKGYYHISSGSDYSIKELFDATLSALDIHLEKDVEVRPRNPDDAFTILIDPSKTEQDFDWRITTSLAEGVAKAIAYYREYGISETYTHLKAVTE